MADCDVSKITYSFKLIDITTEDIAQRFHNIVHPSLVFVYGGSYSNVIAALRQFTNSDKPIVILRAGDEVISEDNFNVRFFYQELIVMYKSADRIIFSQHRPDDRRQMLEYLRSH